MHTVIGYRPLSQYAAIVLRRLIRSLPTRKGVMGVATCDKGLPAMLLALVAQHDLPTILVPGGVTLPATEGEDSGKAQTIGVRYAQGYYYGRPAPAEAYLSDVSGVPAPRGPESVSAPGAEV